MLQRSRTSAYWGASAALSALIALPFLTQLAVGDARRLRRSNRQGARARLGLQIRVNSMPAGYVTTAAEHDEPGYRIQQRMRHKSMDTTGDYFHAGQQFDLTHTVVKNVSHLTRVR